MPTHLTPNQQYHYECAESWRQYYHEDAAPVDGWYDDNRPPKRGARGDRGGKLYELGQQLRARSLRVALVESGVIVPKAVE